MTLIALFKVILAAVLAVVPAAVWGYIFYKKQVGKKTMSLRTFLGGAAFVAPLLVYKYLWQYFPWLNAFAYTHQFQDDFIGFASLTFIPLDVIFTFLIVGVIEELTKFWAVKMTEKGQLASVDDAIEICITVALGFAFVENTIYFYTIITERGPDNILFPFIFRSLFSTFAHVMFSGILGYYYGLSHFAGPIMHDENQKQRWPVFRFFAKIFHFKKDVGFREEKMAQGLFIAILLHAFFNIFLEMNWTFLLVPYLTGGYIFLNYLLEKKADHKIYGSIVEATENGGSPKAGH
jgi:RsiW-degrading membrane proteinase PrsW (M82 family)